MINNKYDKKEAIVIKDKKITYKEFKKNINIFQSSLPKQKIDKIAILAENSPEWIYAFYSCWLNESIAVPLDFMASIDDLTYMIKDCKPEVIFTDKNNKEKINKISPKLDYKIKIIVFNEIKDKNINNINKDFALKTNDEDTAVIAYTSGTSGNPKGVMLSFKNLIVNVKAVCSQEANIYKPDRPVLAILPFHHILPLVGQMLSTFYCGATLVLSPSMQASDLAQTMKNNKIRVMIGVPRLYKILYEKINEKINANILTRTLYKTITKINNKKIAKIVFKKVHKSLGGVSIMVSGGAALDDKIGHFFYNLGFNILEGYGMTEAAPMITFPRPHNNVIGTTGQALPQLEIKIKDGEIIAKGPNIMKGYYNNPDETQKVIKDGWLYTGDLGEMDNKGFLRITGRKKEIIILNNGKNINPLELEEKIRTGSPAIIKDIAVIFYNNALHALIMPKEAIKSQNTNIEEIIKEKCLNEYNKEITPYKRIVNFTIINEEIPKTRLGKIQRFKLEDLVKKYQGQKEIYKDESDNSEEYLLLKNYLEKECKKEISLSSHLDYDLGLDSLARINLLDFIEQTFGIYIKENELNKFDTVKKLLKYIKENSQGINHSEIKSWSGNLRQKNNLKLPATWPTLSIIKNISKVIFNIYFKLSAKGYEKLPDGPCIISPNHQSVFDALFITSFMKKNIVKNTYFYAKKEHFQNKIWRSFASRNNIIIIDIEKNVKESIQKLAQVLKEGKKIVIFPEGTRSQTGKINQFKKTFAILSTELNVPIIPVVIKGAFQALPKGKFFPKIRSKIEINFLQAIEPKNHTSESLKNLVEERIKMMLED